MKHLLFLSLSLGLASATPINLGAIEIIGTATYQWAAGQQIQETLFANSVYLSGLPYAPILINVQTDTAESVSNYQGEPNELMPLGTGCDAWTGTVTIDGVTGGPPCSGGNTATWDIGEYFGLLQIFDAEGDLLVSAQTQELILGPHDDNYVADAQGNISSIYCTVGVSEVPEPGTFLVGLIAAGLIAANMLRLRIEQLEAKNRLQITKVEGGLVYAQRDYTGWPGEGDVVAMPETCLREEFVEVNA